MLKILGKCILVLALLSAVTLSILRVVWGRQLAAEIAAIKARGEPLTVADIPQPQVPDSQNAALIFQRASEGLPRTSEFATTVKEIDSTIEKGSLARASKLLQPFEHRIKLAEQAASMHHCLFPVDDDFGVLIMQWGRLRSLCMLMGCRARLSARQGNANEASSAIQLQLKMAVHPRGKSYYVTFLAQSALIRLITKTLRKTAEYMVVDEENAKILYDSLGRAELEKAYVCAYQGERAYFLDQNANHRNSLWDQAAYLRFLRRSISSAVLTYTEYKANDPLAEIPCYARTAKMVAENVSGAAYWRSRAEISGSQIFLALLAYHDRYGAYPRTLDELRAKLGWPLQKDPFTGEEFIYRRQRKGFILYSLDQDLQDNGGITYIKGSESGAPRDIVWQLSR